MSAPLDKRYLSNVFFLYVGTKTDFTTYIIGVFPSESLEFILSPFFNKILTTLSNLSNSSCVYGDKISDEPKRRCKIFLPLLSLTFTSAPFFRKNNIASIFARLAATIIGVSPLSFFSFKYLEATLYTSSSKGKPYSSITSFATSCKIVFLSICAGIMVSKSLLLYCPTFFLYSSLAPFDTRNLKTFMFLSTTFFISLSNSSLEISLSLSFISNLFL